ncbi:hypothetical protein [Natrinema gelatinilyticum]|uniref:hypothetical protein n=1 Tax=Natrinema gelatinilyticum TaxID=2961571 RepID=UPI0020C2B064|nr:hypothetical protein [Natrinema gelatinilyticum]
MHSYSTYSDLLNHLDQLQVEYQDLGIAPNGDPIVAARTGGDETPTIVITAGSHATEHAGVRAAVECVDRLETDHAVYVVPSRDPIGLNGYASALETALDASVSIESFAAVDEILEDRGEIVYDDDELILALIGDTGFATTRPTEELPSCLRLLTRLKEFQHERPSVLELFRGRRIITPAGHAAVEETGEFGRAYTLVVSPDGELLHLNRFFDRDWAPVETRSVRSLLERVEPGLVIDLHENSEQGKRYHVSLRPTRSGVDFDEEERIGARIVDAVRDIGVPLTTDEDIFGDKLDVVGRTADEDRSRDSSDRFYSRSGTGAYCVDPNVTSPPRSGEGLNAVDLAAEKYGFAFTTETGMHGPFEQRVEAAVVSVKAAIDAFEEPH